MPKATEEGTAAQDAGPATGGAVGGCLLLALAAAACVWMKRRQRLPSGGTVDNRNAPKPKIEQINVEVTHSS